MRADDRDQTPRGAAKTDLPASRATLGTGLAPRDARVWLDLQRALAWRPQEVSERLRAGMDPEAILEAARVVSAGSSRPPVSDRELRRLERLAIRVVPLTDPAYPEALAALTDAPPVLLIRGQVEALSGPAIAIVGARAATHAARTTARRLARELAAAGFKIVSGLARGIDAEAHRGALESAGATIGVLACGPERIYPPEHRRLAEDMERSGGIVSEMPVGVAPRRAHFPLRNRIISGLCCAVIVVEARRRSGSLITVRHALDQGREVFTVPGSIEGPFAEGSNQLLRDGARPIQCARDVIEDLGLPRTPATPASNRSTRATAATGTRDSTRATAATGNPDSTRARAATGNPDSTRATAATGTRGSLQARILGALESGPARRDDLLVHAELETAVLADVLLELELSGRVFEDRDGRIHRTWR